MGGGRTDGMANGDGGEEEEEGRNKEAETGSFVPVHFGRSGLVK